MDTTKRIVEPQKNPPQPIKATMANQIKSAEPYGSVLGIIDSDPDKKLPKAAKDTGGHPRGVEVGTRATGTDELPQRSGFTSADLGGAGQGSGTPEDTEPERPEQE